MTIGTATSGRATPSAGPASWVSQAIVGPIGYLTLAVLLGLLLFVGSGTRPSSTPAARIAHLESEIRCPSCADLSIANSTASVAGGLRVEVSQLVHEGVSDQAIEAKIEGQFPGTLLTPSGDAGFAAYLIPALSIVIGAGLLGAFLFHRRRGTAAGDDDEDVALVERALGRPEASQT